MECVFKDFFYIKMQNPNWNHCHFSEAHMNMHYMSEVQNAT